ncbi:MAG: TIGR03960 family B12-binding radical SAM protein [Dissulfurispiraceae bacterium]|jgi:radical SAM family uncharacterized protein/radical SAM-linked protein
MNFSSFQKPSRYIDSEFNARKKEGQVDIRVALAFPDTYEVGMSHLGLRILYDIINSLPFSAAERVFAPWTDLRDHLKNNGIPLSSLETRRPLRDFDIVGFSLQYELSYTTVLDMLDMAGIPLKSTDRIQSKKMLPLIVAGGPSTVNPAPMAPFLDILLIGDGEEAIVELVGTVRRCKADGGSREDLLREISRIEGFYVPLIHGRSVRVKRRFIPDLETMPFPERQIVPYAAIVHDRISIEVSRGCTMGCRFCQAGIIYRPLRERSPAKILEIADKALKNTGYDEVSFSSLSTGDYSCLLPLIQKFNLQYRQSRIAVALPSLRVASVNRDVLKEIRSVRKTGFTMAPEAATERLRRVINKDFTESDYERALDNLFKEGWLTLKLYFMIGLPTEREEDIEAINEMAMRALRIAKRTSGKFVNINITVSPFIPKPHTPFQWCGQISLDEMRRKLGFLKRSINGKKFKYKGHNEEMSFLEAVFARGDENLAPLIEKAWRLGCRLDGWSEFFDFTKWLQAMEKTDINGAAYAGKEFVMDDPLPWDNIDVGVGRDFLYHEYMRALEGKMTANCRKTCSACGLLCKDTTAPVDLHGNDAEETETALPDTDTNKNLSPMVRVRTEFSKTGMLRYLSHLELITAMTRALRRAGVPFNFSKGFHPKPQISFGPPLNVGVAGEREYFDMEVFTPFDVELYRGRLAETLPDGIKIGRMAVIAVSEPSLTGFVSRYKYIVGVPAGPSTPPPTVPETFETVMVRRDDKAVDLAPCIESVELIDIVSEQVSDLFGYDLAWAYSMVLRDREDVRIRLGEITEALFGIKLENLSVIRTGLYGWKEGWKEPL